MYISEPTPWLYQKDMKSYIANHETDTNALYTL